MSEITGTTQVCAHCGRPIAGPYTWIGGLLYHEECTMPWPSQPPQVYQLAAPVTRDDEIVELLEKILAELRTRYDT